MKGLMSSIYVRFVLIFISILIVSALLSLGAVTAFQLEDLKGMVKEQLEDKLTAIDSLVSEKKIPLQEAIQYFNGQDLTIKVFKNREELSKAGQFSAFKSELGQLQQGMIVTKELKSRHPLPVSAAFLEGQYVIIFPDIHNNQIVRFQKTAQTVLLTAIIMGSLLILLSVSMVVKPIKAISKASVEVAKGNFNIHIHQKGKDEISDLVKNFNIMVQELKSNEYLHKEFVSSVSHEFKTPLSSIHGFGKLLKKKDLSIKEREEYTDIIIEESERLSNLSSNLLRLSKLDHQAVAHRRDTFELDEQIRRVILLLQDLWENKKIQLRVELEKVSFTGDEELLQQIWLNLMVNALKFTPEKGTIKLMLETGDDRVYFSITDNGIGISERDQERIFERFFKAEKSRTMPGTGLGLSIVKKIIEIHGGKISVVSEPGKGSVFCVELPVEKK
ncbi:sensor histidine kinase [Peribacillus frigoritolerans]|uniref:sensor histidine kinase n=1 Tax=Peribacillus frigoritolerans TaxID=450367 RepID=UPI00105A798C|nr:HAMP domain-containing sensor histidine kinase [Peribacillus frigoritolerans]TDL82779.1 HAMP domain-containing histidine kinase [Peribacillus frigoritolerans]